MSKDKAALGDLNVPTLLGGLVGFMNYTVIYGREFILVCARKFIS